MVRHGKREIQWLGRYRSDPLLQEAIKRGDWAKSGAAMHTLYLLITYPGCAFLG